MGKFDVVLRLPQRVAGFPSGHSLLASTSYKHPVSYWTFGIFGRFKDVAKRFVTA